MAVVTDSYMGMFLPEDISQRITLFIGGKLEFPFIRKEELMGTFFIFGKNNGLYGDEEILAATDLGKRTVAHLTKTVRMFHNSPNKMDSNFTRENYTKRVLQISIELGDNTTNTRFSLSQMNKRIAGDPAILTDCFAQHVACHQQDQFFEIFQPLRENHLPVSLRRKLEGRMLLLGFNVKGSSALPYESTLAAFLMWLKKFNS
ncbi:MAG TPA: hypothetical protein VK553_06585 [Candidatus Nitrosopolaris rasttigaisensis]|nr:hypothetical protein [Candidatus Nitrosopolaris rasttigaisensis]